MPDRVTIEELNVPDPLKLVLEGRDLPYAREREKAAFESGGDLAHERIDLPTRPNDPIYHVQNAVHIPLVIQGAWRDWLVGRDGHARSQKSLCEQIRSRANRVKFAWSGEEYEGLLVKTKFGEESERSITYEITIDVARAPNAIQSESTETRASTTDLALIVSIAIAERKKQMTSVSLDQTTLGQIISTLETAQRALDDVQDAVTLADRSVRIGASQLQRIINLAQTAQQIIGSGRQFVRRLTPSHLVQQSPGDLLNLWKNTSGADNDFRAALAALQQIRAHYRRQQLQSMKLYHVQPDDTLESIAEQTLGNRGRIADLGIRQDQLVPGRFIRLPLN